MSGGAMNAERLLDVYEQISEAPDAVARLRRFVLDLAVRGKLVEQDAGDEPASNLFKKFAEQKADLVKRKMIRKPKALKPISDVEELSYTPLGWETQRLGNISILITKGSTPTSYGHEFTQEGVNFLKVESIRNDRVDASSVTAFISNGTHDFLSRSQLEAGDILFSIAGSIGTCAVVSADILPANTNQALAIIRGTATVFSPDFLLLLLRSFVSDAVKDRARGGAMNNVSLTDLQNLVLPIPPLAEQHRIVAKVDELMALCDRLEEARKTREEVRGKLTAASLARLSAPDVSAEDFPTHAAFALEALPALTTRPDQIKSLRQTILNLAVRGKLVEQDAADEPAGEALKRLLHARRTLEEQGRILKVKKIPSLNDPIFEAPRGWEWCPLVTICDVVDPNPSHRMPRYVSSGGQPFISSQNFIDDDAIDYSLGKRVEMKTVEEQISRFSILEGAFGFSRIGTIGKTRPLAQERTYGISHAVCVVNPVSVDDLSMRFLRLAMSAETILEHAHHGTRSVGVPDLGMGVIRSMGIALPPLAEQHRILAKVDALMALCDRLEAALTEADTTRTRLLEALLHEALEPATDTLEAAE